jgi:hypothetical protein
VELTITLPPASINQLRKLSKVLKSDFNTKEHLAKNTDYFYLNYVLTEFERLPELEIKKEWGFVGSE